MPIVGWQKLKTQNKHPIIEIAGPVDVGKKAITRALTTRSNAAFVESPSLTGFSISGISLVQALNKPPEFLQRNYVWYQHLWASHICEIADQILDQKEEGPVFVNNYMFSWIFWSAAYRRSLPYLRKWEQALFSEFPTRAPRPDLLVIIDSNEHWEDIHNIPNDIVKASKLHTFHKALLTEHSLTSCHNLPILIYQMSKNKQSKNINDRREFLSKTADDILTRIIPRAEGLELNQSQILDSMFYSYKKD